MSGRLPQTVQAGRLADAGETLQGTMHVHSMSRLADFLHDTEGEVDVELVFDVDVRRLRHVQGHLKTTINLVCQRCLQPLAWPLEVDFKLGLVTSEAAAERLPETWDPLIVDESGLVLQRLVEDELLLALPIVPMHAVGECDLDRDVITEPAPATAPSTQADTRRPFEHLADLLKDKQ